MPLLFWPDPPLEEGEFVKLGIRGNWSRKGFARGGTLVLTDRRLIFTPNSLEVSTGLKVAAWAASTIETVDVAPRGWHPFSGSLRRRLRIGLRGGSPEFFVVADVHRVAQKITALLRAPD